MVQPLVEEILGELQSPNEPWTVESRVVQPLVEKILGELQSLDVPRMVEPGVV